MGAISNKIKGTAKAIEGKLTGDRVRSAQGKAQKGLGDIEGKVNRVSDRVRGKVAKAQDRSRARKAR
jgi:uncharacterized protein YjbJ (UPF0337 family)